MSELGEVFISYSWDNEEHIRDVLALSNRLRTDGIDCVLDQYEVSPPEGWPLWMDRKVANASLVLVICTETYLDRVMGREPSAKCLGVKWEGTIIYQHLYNQGANNLKFIPVLLKPSDRSFIPVPLQGASFFAVDNDAGYGRLYSRLLGKPPAEKPPLGKRKAVPKREVKTNPVGYIASPINIPLWNAAKWKATLFANLPGTGPVLGIAFLNKTPAETIFQEWNERYGKSDKFEELRISIIEGDIPGEAPGYSVNVGIDCDNVLARYKQAGFKINEGFFLASISRIHRMNPEPGSPYLSLFKAEFKKRGEYLLVPAICEPDGSNPRIGFEWAIRKKMIYFRNVRDITPNDPDYVVLKRPQEK